MTGTPSQRQLRRREAGWEGSPRQTSDPRNTNPIKGGHRRTSRQVTANSKVIQGGERGWGGFEGRSRALPREAHESVVEAIISGEDRIGEPGYQAPYPQGRPIASRPRAAKTRRSCGESDKGNRKIMGVSRNHSSSRHRQRRGLNSNAWPGPKPRLGPERRR
jgi:hypothetical protein